MKKRRKKKTPRHTTTTVTTEFFTTGQAAKKTKLTRGRITQICRDSCNGIGVKLGRDWHLTQDDIDRINNRPDLRKNNHGG